MHGVKRSDLSAAALDGAASAVDESQEIQHYRGLVANVFACRDESPIDISRSMSCTSDLLLINPDHLCAWNVRKAALLELRSVRDYDAWQQELEYSLSTIKVNPKSYGSWYHRQWLLSNWSPDCEAPVDVKHELKLCAKLLDLDARNCINYACWLVIIVALLTGLLVPRCSSLLELPMVAV